MLNFTFDAYFESYKPQKQDLIFYWDTGYSLATT